MWEARTVVVAPWRRVPEDTVPARAPGATSAWSLGPDKITTVSKMGAFPWGAWSDPCVESYGVKIDDSFKNGRFPVESVDVGMYGK